ncbi:hypothetical protein HQ590_13510, partial [bacterium]|nr:hypothetical protein [bacterium]
LNNPLSIISGYTQLLSRDLASLESGNVSAAQDMQQRLLNIQSEIERCRDIARRFLGFARARQVAPEAVPAATLLEDTGALLHVHPATRDVTVTINAGEPGLRLEVYPAEVLQVLLNLAVNALQALGGTGQLTLGAAAAADIPAEPSFRAPSFKPGRPLVRLSVTDTGPGISPEKIAQILQPYVTTKKQGTGVGLALVCEIVGTHGGLLQVDSTVGKGTTFSVYLPRAQSVQ